MSLLGIDIGTTGCKSVVFSTEGEELAISYREYDFIIEKPGFAELNSFEVWTKIKETIKDVTTQTANDPVTALSTSSMGEAMVPVTKNRKILGNSILGNDLRGKEFLLSLLEKITPEEIFQINGNIADVFFSFSKIAWLKKYKPELYEQTDYFLTWADFVCFMLGGTPVVNYSLANKTLLFDTRNRKWSEKLINLNGIDISKLPPPVESGIFIGTVSEEYCNELFLHDGVAIISGGHDQCCATVGSGIIGNSNTAMYGMGTYICIVPVFSEIPHWKSMFENKLHFEHHVIPGLYISFIYNISGGALVKWCKNNFASPHRSAPDNHSISYDELFKELSDKMNDIIVIPRFGPTGPPDFFKKNAGTISGLAFHHTRSDILLATLEGITFHFKEFFESDEKNFFHVETFIANGGGAKSDRWLQITADILNKPVIRNKSSEAGTLGAAILAGSGSKVFPSINACVESIVKKDKVFMPIPENVEAYAKKYKEYLKLHQFLKDNSGE